MIVTCLSLALVAAVAESGNEPKLLPDAPEDWRFERIDFPLPFAPELKYDGFEELRFAPGMFNVESDTYFTYVFAMKISNTLPVSAAWFKTFLETYFRGLCRTVAKGSEFDIDVTKISAAVREDHYEAQSSRHFRVTLDSFDPFVTGKPLKLYLEVLVVETSADDHRIIAAVSPQRVDSPVWTQLRKIKLSAQAHAKKSGE